MAEEEKQNIEDLVNQKVLSGEYIVRPKDSQSPQNTYTAQDIFRGSLSPEYEGTDVAPDTVIKSDDTAPRIDSLADSSGLLGPSKSQPSQAFTQAYTNALLLHKLGGYPGIMPGEHDAGKPPPPVGVWDNLKALAQKRGFQKFAGTLATAALGDKRDVAEFTHHWNQIQEADAAETRAKDQLRRQQIEDARTRDRDDLARKKEQREDKKFAQDQLTTLAQRVSPEDMMQPRYAELWARSGIEPGTDLSGRVYMVDRDRREIRRATLEEIEQGLASTYRVAGKNLDTIFKTPKLSWSEQVVEKIETIQRLYPDVRIQEDDIRSLIELPLQSQSGLQTIRGEDGQYYVLNPKTMDVKPTGIKAYQKGDKQKDKYPKIIANATTGYNDVAELIDIVNKIGLRKTIMLGSTRFGTEGQNIDNLKQMIADKIGRLRSGGAINKEEEARFLNYLSLGWGDWVWGTAEGTVGNLQRLQNEFKTVIMRIDEEFGGTITNEDFETLDRSTELDFGTSSNWADYRKKNRRPANPSVLRGIRPNATASDLIQ